MLTVLRIVMDCKHLDKRGITITYKSPDNIKCIVCGEKLTNEEFRELVIYTSTCHIEGKPYV